MFVVKRRGIQDDIVGGVRKIVSPWLGASPTQPRQVTRAQGVARGAAEGLDQVFAGGMIKAGVRGDKALVKQAAVNTAALGVGYIAGKAVQTAVGAVKSGRVVNPAAAARNVMSGERVVLHGSPKTGLPVLQPSLGSKTLPNQNVLFSWNPRKSNMSNVIHTKAARYANKGQDAGSIYVAKVPKRATLRHPKPSVTDSKNMLVTRGEGKIVAEVPLGKQYSELSRAERVDVANRVQAELRKAGVQPRGMPRGIDNALMKVDDALWRAEYKIKRKISQTFLTPAQQAARESARRKRQIR